MSRKNKRLKVDADGVIEQGWKITQSASPRVDVMTTRVHGLQGKDKTRAERRKRRAIDRMVDVRTIREERDYV